MLTLNLSSVSMRRITTVAKTKLYTLHASINRRHIILKYISKGDITDSQPWKEEFMSRRFTKMQKPNKKLELKPRMHSLLEDCYCCAMRFQAVNQCFSTQSIHVNYDCVGQIASQNKSLTEIV